MVIVVNILTLKLFVVALHSFELRFLHMSFVAEEANVMRKSL